MKILHLVPTYLPAYRYGGPIGSVHNLNKWLVKKGIDITVYTTNLDGPKTLEVPLGREVVLDGVKIYYWPVTFRFWQYSSLMRRAIEENIKKFDLIHITSVFLSVSTTGAYYARKYKKPYIISPRGSLMMETLRKKSLKKKIYLLILERRNLAGAAAIHFTTEKEKEEYLTAGLPLISAVVIPNGLDPAEFGDEMPSGSFRKKFNISSSKKVVLFLGRLSWKKGLDSLIPAFAEVAKTDPNTILVLAGGDDEGYRQNIQLLITNCQLQSRVVFTGTLLGKDRIAAYQESDLFVLPSYAENFGQVVLEAMYFGLPVVITEGVALGPHTLRAGAGLVVSKNGRQLAEAILKILANPTLAREMGERGKQLVRREFSWPSLVDAFIQAYRAASKRES